MTHARVPSLLWQRLKAAGMRTVAVMGMAKNTGKTVALNHLLDQAAADGVSVGLTSIGRDGEERDAVFNFPKPPVTVWPGTVVATARGTLQRARLRHKLIDATGVDSPMGEIVLIKALEGGDMEVAGASRSLDQRRVIRLLRQCGAELVFLDGALGRSQHASPAIADGVVLATGAALGGGMGDVQRKTRERLALLGLPQADAATAARCASLFDGAGVALWGRDGQPLFSAEIASLNASGALLAFADAHAEAHADIGIATVACTGAVGRSLWRAFETLAARHPGLTVVVADGTRLFVDSSDLGALARLGARLVALRPIRIAGISLNPFSPLGGHFDAAAFTAAMREALPEHAVTDVRWDTDHRTQTESPHGPLAA
ncbi:MAG: hypothetical protein Q8K45_10420 [Rubrivivax sp.]|nr:hypothetical protein [Rubrivivax sp.]